MNNFNFKLEKELLDKVNKRTGAALRSLKDCDENGWNTLMLALANNKEKYLDLNKEQIDYLLYNSHINQQSLMGETALSCAIINNKKENLKLSDDQWDYLIDYSELKKEHLDYATKYNEKIVQQKIIARFEKIHNMELQKEDEIVKIIEDIEENGKEGELELVPVVVESNNFAQKIL